jgi:hypothetical protein
MAAEAGEFGELWPDYDVYQTRTGRSIPLAIIERI